MSAGVGCADTIRSSYAKDGFCFPIPVLGPGELKRYGSDLLRAWERGQALKLGNKGQLNFPHVLFPFAYEIVRHPGILDAVEAVIGPDILVWGGTFFFKPPHSGGFVSWHQDLTYWGLAETDGLVSAWLALEDVDRENGCMQFLPGTHQGGLRVHSDTWTANNILTRGQSVAIDEDACDIVHVELRAGEMSLHHGHLLHASGPNHSGRWRLGFNINYITPGNRQTVAPRDFAMLVRGKDRFGHFSHVDPPAGELDEAALGWHRRILDAQNDALYSEGAA
ncbi:MAG: phytanoyl-CoA dioxygenase family protein [Gammaproteobacteria bacterium]|nr:phytanoyl-CoA dioxygenase family protein [Gammaproteobacteria bacterium]MXX16872.1 phytanoyl-CoA dioxygenase family protein [Gammaproteobacteria bacterium]